MHMETFMADRKYPTGYADREEAKEKKAPKSDPSGGRTVVIETGDERTVVTVPAGGRDQPKRKQKGPSPD
jgi:hypothetical protein